MYPSATGPDIDDSAFDLLGTIGTIGTLVTTSLYVDDCYGQ